MAKRSHASYVKAGKKAAATRKRKAAKKHGKKRGPKRGKRRSPKLARIQHAKKITITVTPSR